MRKIITYLFAAAVLWSCHESAEISVESEDIPGHPNFENGWEIENLKGRVKSLKQYKTYVENSESGNTDEPSLQFIKSYNSFGNTVREEYFGAFGELEQIFEGNYSGVGSSCETVWKIIGTGDQTTTFDKYDTTTGRIATREVFMNDSIQEGISFYYDDRGNLKELKPLSNEFNGHISHEYSHDEKGRILSEIQLRREAEKIDTLSIRYYHYDSSGNKVVQAYNSTLEFVPDSRTKHEYDAKNRLKASTHFEAGQKVSTIEFDFLGNEVLQTEYAEGALSNQTRMHYEYDKHGNWIKQRVFRSEQDGEAIPILVKIREIEYFD